MKVKLKICIYLIISILLMLLNIKSNVYGDDVLTFNCWANNIHINLENNLINENEAILSYKTIASQAASFDFENGENGYDDEGEYVNRIYGQLTWTTNTGIESPFRDLIIMLFDNNNLLLDTTYSDEYGNYFFEFYTSIDDIENGYSVYIRIYAKSETFEVLTIPYLNYNTGYYIESNQVTLFHQYSTKCIDINITEPLNTNTIADTIKKAFILSQGLVTAQNFALNMGMEYDDILQVMYPYEIGDTSFCWDEISIIHRDDYNKYDTLMHEYGHYVEFTLGNYGASLSQIALNNPNHSLDSDHFVDKEDKEYAEYLTWSESWATVFMIIGQQYYLNYYYNIIDYYGDYKYDDINYDIEEFIADNNSCSAQELALCASLYDIFDSHYDETGLNIDDDLMNLTYQEWFNITTENYIKSISDFFNNLFLYHKSYINNMAVVFESHNISPGLLSITNVSLFTDEIVPIYSWTVNGSLNNPINQFDLLFYDENWVLLNSITGLNSTLSYNENYSYNINLSTWRSVIFSQNDSTVLNIIIKGYTVFDDYISGPVYSNVLSIDVGDILENHECSCTSHYVFYNNEYHKAYCDCGEYELVRHCVRINQSGRYKTCLLCGATIDTQNTITPGILCSPIIYSSENGSFILSDGNLLLSDDDMEDYFNGTLEFELYEE